MNFTSDQYVKLCSILEGTSVSIVKFPSKSYVINQIIVCFLNCLLSVATVLLNGIAIFTIYKCFRLKVKVCYFLIFIQSIVDLITGAVSIPLFTFVLASELTGTANCVVNFIISTVAFIPMGLSLAMLCALSFERYMGVLHPVVHLTHVTKNRLLQYLCLVTLAIFVMVLVSLVYKTLYYIFASVNICVSLMLITFIYTRIFLAARRQFRSENRPGHGLMEPVDPTEIKKKRLFLKEFKLAKSCFLVIIIFLLCFLPVFIISILSINVRLEMVPRFRLLQSWFITLALSNHSINSIIFFWTRPLLKKEAKNALKNICGNKFD